MGDENTNLEATRPLSALWERPLPTPKCSTEGLTFTVDSWSPWNEGKFLVEIEVEIEDDVNWAVSISGSTFKSHNNKKPEIKLISQD